jgi:hypothetical protein
MFNLADYLDGYGIAIAVSVVLFILPLLYFVK